MECFKNCCKNFLQKNEKEERETQVIAMKMPQNKTEDEKRRANTDDYLLSKMPPNGREVPFVVPTLVQPRVKPPSPSSRPTHHPSVRNIYTQRKAELRGSTYFSYSPEGLFHHGDTSPYASPGSPRRDTIKSLSPRLHSPGRTLKHGNPERLSSSMLDLSSFRSPRQSLGSSPFSSTSSMISSVESSTESISVFGDEQQLGKVCVRLSYREDLEQVWITLVQCLDLNLDADGAEEQKVGLKGFITVPKPIQFKSCIRDYSQDVSFMQSFVFALRLEQLRSCALVLRLQAHAPRKRTVAESVLSLRRLGPEESEHWLDLNTPSKSPACHSELHLSTCFQPVNGRVQLQVLAAQSLPPTSSPLSLRFFVTAEMQQTGRKDTRKKCRAVKALEGQCRWGETFHFLLASLEQPCSLSVRLYSYSSVRRKCCLGQVLLGFDSPVPEAVEQWTDTMTHPEKVVTAWLRLSPP
uniref:Tandem C2 domains, nuclear n=1 Tax=Oryzias latipes TaxID=8090 RepID=A0A3P9JUA9_ORYLA